MAGVSSCMKYTMFIFNFIFWVCGCIILGVSIWLRLSVSDVDISDSSAFTSIYILIAVGSIIMVLGFLGCCGAMKESQCMLLLFFIGLLAILLLQIVAGVYGGVHKSQMQDVLNKTLNETSKLLQTVTTTNKEALENFHKFEIKNKCCGLFNGVSDWGQNLNTYDGCVCDKEDQKSNDCAGNRYKEPCGAIIIKFFKENMAIVMGIAFGLAFIEVLGMVFSMILYCQIQGK
ncbi:tetraspanin-8 [Elgaria multicarinata webbii]|uniref:tetraspanin-8 n=1 Tax=Elgaria multicarinata webbii TaxID=159646 RepID=UPI002FCD073F